MSDFGRRLGLGRVMGGGGGELRSGVGERVFLGGLPIFSYYTYYYYFYYLVKECAASVCEWVLHSESKFL